MIQQELQTADIRVIGNDLKAVQGTLASMGADLKAVAKGLDVLTGQLSVRCPAEEERISRVEQSIITLRRDAFSETTNLRAEIERQRTWMLSTLALAAISLGGVILTLVLRR